METLQRPKTRIGAPDDLLPSARHLILPDGIVSSGFPAVEATCKQLGLSFDAWQRDLNKCILAKTGDGLYAADMVALSIGRQVGKTWNIGALVFADSIITPGTTTVWTAHQFKVARETFEQLKTLADSPQLKRHIRAVHTAAGNEAIHFNNGSRIVFAARERGAIRGFSKVRRLVIDEAQILTERALADLAPTMNQAVNPQIIFMGTPPRPVDPGEVFSRLRTEALKGESDDVLYVELSADPDADPDDDEQIKKANPSYLTRTPKRAIKRLRKMLSLEDYLREVLGIWDTADMAGAFSRGAWARCLDESKANPVPTALGVAADLGQTRLSLAASSASGAHVGSVLQLPFETARERFVSEVARIVGNYDYCPVAIDERGPASALIEDLELAGVHVLHGKLEDYIQACADFHDAVETTAVTHANYTELNSAVNQASWRNVQDRRVFGRRGGDISMLEAATWARWAAIGSTYDLMESVR